MRIDDRIAAPPALRKIWTRMLWGRALPSGTCDAGRQRCVGIQLRVHDGRQQLEAVDQARAWTAEVRRSVDHEDLPGTRCRQVREAGVAAEGRQVGPRASDVEAAAGDDEDLGLRPTDLVPRHLRRI